MHFWPKLAHLCKAKVANNGQTGQKLPKIIQKHNGRLLGPQIKRIERITKDWCGQKLTTIIDNLAMD